MKKIEESKITEKKLLEDFDYICDELNRLIAQYRITVDGNFLKQRNEAPPMVTEPIFSYEIHSSF